MKRITFIKLFFVLFGSTLVAQPKIWHFGDKAGIDFNTNPPKAIKTNFYSGDGCTVLYDHQRVLFATNGVNIWDKQGQILSQYALLGGISCTQTALVMPILDSNICNQYFLFTLPEIEAWRQDYLTGQSSTLPSNVGLRVSLVTIDENENIVINPNELNQSLLPTIPMAEKIAITSDNNGGYWLVVHRASGNDFYTLHITPQHKNINDLQTIQPIITKIGHQFSDGRAYAREWNGVNGQMKFSLDGTKLALALQATTFFEWYDFNPITGQISNHHQIPAGGTNAYLYGLEFSPNSLYIYYSHLPEEAIQGTPLQIGQYSITTGTFTDIHTFYSTTALPRYFGSMQLAPDGKIYIAKWEQASLDIIQKPNGDGIGVGNCSFAENGIYLASGSMSKLGLPTCPINIKPLCQNVGVINNSTDKCCSDGELTLFPNPANNVLEILEIKLGTCFEEHEIKIVDMSGRVILKERHQDKNIRYNVNMFENGIYYLTVSNERTSCTKKILITH